MSLLVAGPAFVVAGFTVGWLGAVHRQVRRQRLERASRRAQQRAVRQLGYRWRP